MIGFFLFPFIIGIIYFIIGFFVYFADKKHFCHQTFLVYGLLAGLWSMALGFFNIWGEKNFIWIDFIGLVTIFLPMFVFFLAYNFPKAESIMSKKLEIINWLVAISMFIFYGAFPRLFIKNVVVVDNLPIPQAGPLFLISIAYQAIYFIIAFVVIIRTLRKFTGRLRAEMITVILGAFVAFTAVILIAAFFTLTQPERSFYWLSPAFALVGAITYVYILFKAESLDYS